jgi:hypothetical protein
MKTAPSYDGTTRLAITTLGLSQRNTKARVTGPGTQYLIRSLAAIYRAAVDQTVNTHRYREVSESLSNSELQHFFGLKRIFFLSFGHRNLTGFRRLKHLNDRREVLGGVSSLIMHGIKLRRLRCQGRQRAGLDCRLLCQF